MDGLILHHPELSPVRQASMFPGQIWLFDSCRAEGDVKIMGGLSDGRTLKLENEIRVNCSLLFAGDLLQRIQRIDEFNTKTRFYA
jgi:hypothetical protein